jgi:2'-5' RNA ligase
MARDRARRPGAAALRLFVAIEIPDVAKAAVCEAFAPWRERFPDARWVPPESQHVTVKFLGSTWPRLAGWVPDRVAEVAAEHGAFSTRVLGVGAFPSVRRARVLWTGLDDRGGRIAELAQALDGALAHEFKPENRAFRAHLTVARSDPAIALPDAFGETALESEPFEVDHLVLFRSHLQRPAPRYEPLSRFPLGSPRQ